MNIRLANYTLHYDRNNALKHGDKVCPANGASSVGMIVNIEKRRNDWEGSLYTVLWGSPKSKRGKTSAHPGRNLVDVKRYLEAIQKEADAINALIDEASTLGM